MEPEMELTRLRDSRRSGCWNAATALIVKAEAVDAGMVAEKVDSGVVYAVAVAAEACDSRCTDWFRMLPRPP